MPLRISWLLEASLFESSSLTEPDAWVGHIPFAAWLIRELNPAVFVELGVHTGNSYFAFCEAVKKYKLKTKCYAVDTWQGDEHSEKYSGDVYKIAFAHNQSCYKSFSQFMRKTFDSAVHEFEDGSIHLLHIDGLHTYEAVKNDFDTWYPKMALGGIILLHDTNVRENNFGVWRLFEDLKKTYPSAFEFTHSHGLGVVQVKVDGDMAPIECFNLKRDDHKLFINFFEKTGANFLSKYQNERDKKKLLISQQEIESLSAQIVRYHQTVLERDASLDQKQQEIQGLSNYYDSGLVGYVNRFLKKISL